MLVVSRYANCVFESMKKAPVRKATELIGCSVSFGPAGARTIVIVECPSTQVIVVSK